MDTNRLNDELTAAVKKFDERTYKLYLYADAPEETREYVKQFGEEVTAALETFQKSIINCLNEK